MTLIRDEMIDKEAQEGEYGGPGRRIGGRAGEDYAAKEDLEEEEEG